MAVVCSSILLFMTALTVFQNASFQSTLLLRDNQDLSYFVPSRHFRSFEQHNNDVPNLYAKAALSSSMHSRMN